MKHRLPSKLVLICLVLLLTDFVCSAQNYRYSSPGRTSKRYNKESTASPYRYSNPNAKGDGYTGYRVVDRDYRIFKFGMYAGLFFSEGFGVVGGFEPAFRIDDNFALGARVEFVHGESTGGFIDLGTNLVAQSYSGNLTISFGKRVFRPFIGVGYGIQNVQIKGSYRDYDKNNFTTPVLYPRIGFDLGHAQLTFEYNVVKDKTVTGTYDRHDPGNPTPQPFTEKIKSEYGSLKLGFFFGGGHIK